MSIPTELMKLGSMQPLGPKAVKNLSAKLAATARDQDWGEILYSFPRDTLHFLIGRADFRPGSAQVTLALSRILRTIPKDCPVEAEEALAFIELASVWDPDVLLANLEYRTIHALFQAIATIHSYFPDELRNASLTRFFRGPAVAMWALDEQPFDQSDSALGLAALVAVYPPYEAYYIPFGRQGFVGEPTPKRLEKALTALAGGPTWGPLVAHKPLRKGLKLPIGGTLEQWFANPVGANLSNIERSTEPAERFFSIFSATTDADVRSLAASEGLRRATKHTSIPPELEHEITDWDDALRALPPHRLDGWVLRKRAEVAAATEPDPYRESKFSDEVVFCNWCTGYVFTEEFTRELASRMSENWIAYRRGVASTCALSILAWCETFEASAGTPRAREFWRLVAADAIAVAPEVPDARFDRLLRLDDMTDYDQTVLIANAVTRLPPARRDAIVARSVPTPAFRELWLATRDSSNEEMHRFARLLYDARKDPLLNAGDGLRELPAVFNKMLAKTFEGTVLPARALRRLQSLLSSDAGEALRKACEGSARKVAPAKAGRTRAAVEASVHRPRKPSPRKLSPASTL